VKPQVLALALNSRVADVRSGIAKFRQRSLWTAIHAFATERLLWSDRVPLYLLMAAMAGLAVVPAGQTTSESTSKFCISPPRKAVKEAASNWTFARVSSGAMAAASCGHVLRASGQRSLLQASSVCVSWRWSKADR